ncbi:MAG: GNAT family N-acetyltransferase [Pseudomonadota bacterium]|jgi:ribosomal protein S18 acetylase RimI-like enzyme
MAAGGITIRRAERADVPAIVRMLADDFLGKDRERVEDPLPQSYADAFERVAADRNIHLVVAIGESGAVVGSLQLCILAGLSSQGATRALIEDVRVDGRLRGQGIGEVLLNWAIAESKARGCHLIELFTSRARVDAQRFYVKLGFTETHAGMTLKL